MISIVYICSNNIFAVLQHTGVTAPLTDFPGTANFVNM